MAERIRVEIPRDLPRPPAQAANFFHLTSAGIEVQLLVGFVDLQSLHEARQVEAEEMPVSAEMTHRFFMSMNGFLMLKERVDQIFSQLEAGGILNEADIENTDQTEKS